MNPSACIKTLSSSGLTTNGPVILNNTTTNTRTLAMPPGETQINDISLTPSGYGLFSAAGDKVRLWDLRKFHSIGKLSGGHQAAIMCLATGPTDVPDNNYVITGSKDHYIKVFEVPENKGGVIAPKMNLDPPHYDGIQCMAVSGDTLFSASRDTCIKKWDLKTQELVKSLNNAHKDWICGLTFLPGGNIVVSGCRAGTIKLWSAETCNLIGEMKAHNSTINTIATNYSHIFTASNDGSIGMWRLRSNYDRSPDSESS
jgi:WD40 repeat protein